jgi:hypothetical protein
MPQGNPLNSVMWTGDQLVAVGDGGAILASPDGLDWSAGNSGSAIPLSSVAWMGSRGVAVGTGYAYDAGGKMEYGHGDILTSADGRDWMAGNSGAASPLLSVTWAGTRFVAVGLNGAVGTSSDGITWTPGTSASTRNSGAWLGQDPDRWQREGTEPSSPPPMG